jgi:hypothetical protein
MERNQVTLVREAPRRLPAAVRVSVWWGEVQAKRVIWLTER